MRRHSSTQRKFHLWVSIEKESVTNPSRGGGVLAKNQRHVIYERSLTVHVTVWVESFEWFHKCTMLSVLTECS